MNYSMQGMTKTIPELFVMVKLTKVEIKKEHQVSMVNKTTSFKMNGKQVATPVKKPKAGRKPETECFYCKGTGHWKRNYPKYLADKKDGKVNKLWLIYMLLMCTLLVFIVAPGYLILVRLLKK